MFFRLFETGSCISNASFIASEVSHSDAAVKKLTILKAGFVGQFL